LERAETRQDERSETRTPLATRANFCKLRKKTRRWPRPANGANGSSRIASSAGITYTCRLSHKLAEIDDPVKREGFLKAVAHGSAAAWEHVNLLGEYDLSEDNLKDSVGIKPPQLTD
jgi:hypothetical protein